MAVGTVKWFNATKGYGVIGAKPRAAAFIRQAARGI
jgi:cold shock CspA family protein